MRHHYLILIPLLLLISACTPLTVVRMEPAADATVDRYLYGAAVQTQKLGDLEVSTSYYDADREYVVFDLEIFNAGKEPVTYDPEQSWLADERGQRLPAVDPEVQLFSMDMDHLRQIKGQRIATAVSLAALTAGAVIAADNGVPIVDAANDNLAAGLATDVVYLSVDAVLVPILTRARQEPLEFTSGERDFWLNQTIRKTTIRPGERAFGKLAFRRQYAGNGAVELITEVNGQEVSFAYYRREFELRSGQRMR